jgi:hypothetical protein
MKVKQGYQRGYSLSQYCVAQRLAPTATQSLDSHLMEVTSTGDRFVVEHLRISLVQMSQLMSMTRNGIALRFGTFALDMLVHQERVKSSRVHSEVEIEAMPRHSLTIPQSLLDKLYWKKMCATIS